MSEHTPETAQVTTPPCPKCGHALTAAYDDGDGFWECDGCKSDFEDRDLRLPPGTLSPS